MPWIILLLRVESHPIDPEKRISRQLSLVCRYSETHPLSKYRHQLPINPVERYAV